MSIPSLIDTQIRLSQFGVEQRPVTIVLKGTMWVVVSKIGRISLREYQGQRNVFDPISEVASSYYSVTKALTISNTISTDKFWLWTIENGALYFTEVEPFIDGPPSLSYKILVEQHATATEVIIFPTTGFPFQDARAVILDEADFGDKLTLSFYPITAGLPAVPILPGTPPGNYVILKWKDTKLPEFSVLPKDAGTKPGFLLAGVEASSPPNIILDEWLEGSPPVESTLTLELIGSATIRIVEGEDYVELGATAFDSVEGVLTPYIVTTQLNPIPTPTVKGTYTVQYSVSNTIDPIHGDIKLRTVFVVKPIPRKVSPFVGPLLIFTDDLSKPKFLDSKTVNYSFPLKNEIPSPYITDTLNYKNCYRSLSIDVTKIQKPAKFSIAVTGTKKQATGSVRIYGYRQNSNFKQYKPTDNISVTYSVRDNWAYIELIPVEQGSDSSTNTKTFTLNVDDFWDHIAIAIFGVARSVSIYSNDLNDNHLIKIGKPV